MNTAFRDIDLEIIRYSIVWEDYAVLEGALQLGKEDTLGIITSAGCNVLNAALGEVKKIYAIDINPTQNLLLEFKIYLIQYHDFSCYEDLLGFHGLEKVNARCKELLPVLPEKFARLIPQIQEFGMLQCGRLEKYIRGFFPTYPHLRSGFLDMLELKSGQERVKFLSSWDQANALKQNFSAYFEAAQLSKGRDPKLFQFSDADAGMLFYQRLIDYLQRWEGELPFIFRFFFFGLEAMPVHLRPAAYREENFAALQEAVNKIVLVSMEAIDFFQTGAFAQINKFALSNIFEYCTAEEFDHQFSWLLNHTKPNSRFIHWNLLNHQDHPDYLLKEMSEKKSLEESCFYFQNLKIYQK